MIGKCWIWEESKQSDTLAADKYDLFNTVNGYLMGLGADGAVTGTFWNTGTLCYLYIPI